MRLYLVQHGKATSKEENPDRPLTAQGRQEARAVAEFVRPLGLKVDRMWHSGKTRAKQTAEIFARAMKIGEGPSAQQGLGPDDYVTPLRDELGATSDDTMIVGHMPFLGRLAALLLTGFEAPPVVTFVNAGLVCLERTGDNRWQVEWAVTPELLGD